MKILCFALFACAFICCSAIPGCSPSAMPAFFGGAAYFTAHCRQEWGVPPELGVLLGVVGACTSRRSSVLRDSAGRGIYFAMITRGAGPDVLLLLPQAGFTRGEDGIQSVPPRPSPRFIDLSQPTNMYYFVLAVFVIGIAMIWRIINSPFGMILKSIRENRDARDLARLLGQELQTRSLR